MTLNDKLYFGMYIEFVYFRIPWENPQDVLPHTDDEDVFQMIARTFADSLPSIYKQGTCSQDLPSGIVHGADIKGDSNAVMMDEVYQSYHSLMVLSFLLDLVFFGSWI